MRTAKVGFVGALAAILAIGLAGVGDVWAEGGVPRIRTDRKVYPYPPLPKLPTAGGTFVDPTFGTTIMRVTDEKDGNHNINAYANWPVLNCDSTYFHIQTGRGAATLYRFDPDAFKILSKGPLFAKSPEGGTPVWEQCVWSWTDPRILVCHAGTRLWAYDVVDRKYKLLRDFAADMPAGARIYSPTFSQDDNIFAFTKQKRGFVGFIVWRRDQDRILYDEKKIPGHVKRCLVDKDGEYVVLLTQRQGAGVAEQKLVHLKTGKVTDILDDVHAAPGHPDVGHGSVVGSDNWKNRVTFRTLAEPHKITTILKFPKWAYSSHFSFLADDEDWVLASLYAGTKGKKARWHGVFTGEIVLVATDGSRRVKRLVHHRSCVRGYWDTPRAAISKDGRFVAFTSSWCDENPKRQDVFIVRLPQQKKPGAGKVKEKEATR